MNSENEDLRGLLDPRGAAVPGDGESISIDPVRAFIASGIDAGDAPGKVAMDLERAQPGLGRKMLPEIKRLAAPAAADMPRPDQVPLQFAAADLGARPARVPADHDPAPRRVAQPSPRQAGTFSFDDNGRLRAQENAAFRKNGYVIMDGVRYDMRGGGTVIPSTLRGRGEAILRSVRGLLSPGEREKGADGSWYTRNPDGSVEADIVDREPGVTYRLDGDRLVKVPEPAILEELRKAKREGKLKPIQGRERTLSKR